jgi:hypothetical protein
MPYTQNGSRVGADLNNTATTAQFSLMQRASGSQDTMWVYVQMAGAATTGMLCSINTGGTATPCLTSGGSNVANTMIAFAQNSFADTEYGWLCYHGNNVYIRVSGTTSPSGVLYVATSSGLLHTTSASGTLGGVSLLAPVSSTAVGIAVLANLTWPKFVNAGN